MVVLPHPIAVHGSLNGLEKPAPNNYAAWLSTIIDADDGRKFYAAKNYADHCLLKKNLSQPSVASSNVSLTNTCSSSSSLSVFRVSRHSAFSPFVAVVQQQQKQGSAENVTVNEKFCSPDKCCPTDSLERRITLDETRHRFSKENLLERCSINANEHFTGFTSQSDYNNSIKYSPKSDLEETSDHLERTEPTMMIKLRKPNALTAPRLLQENVRDNDRRLFFRRSNYLKLSNVLLPLKYEEIFPLCSNGKDELRPEGSPVVDRNSFSSIVEIKTHNAFDRESAFTLPLSKNRRKLETWSQNDSHRSSMRDVVQKIREMEKVLRSWSLQ